MDLKFHPSGLTSRDDTFAHADGADFLRMISSSCSEPVQFFFDTIFSSMASGIFIEYLQVKFTVMNELIIDKKKYVLILRKEYEKLQKKAALKTRPEKTFSLADARMYSKRLVRKWAKEE